MVGRKVLENRHGGVDSDSASLGSNPSSPATPEALWVKWLRELLPLLQPLLLLQANQKIA
jgi:hypothetical protein